MGHIADGEFPDDELTDLTYMLEANDNFSDLLHDLIREDDGPGTKVRIGHRKLVLATIITAIKAARNQDQDYETAVKPWLDGAD